MRIVLFEDDQCRQMYPVGLFRPLFDVHIASRTLFGLVKSLGLPVDVLIRRHFLFEDNGDESLCSSTDDACLFLNASIEPDTAYLDILKRLISSGDPFISTSANRVSAAFLPAGTSLPEKLTAETVSPFLLELPLPLETGLFRTIDRPHEIIVSHLRLFTRNLENILTEGNFTERSKNVYTGQDANIHDSVCFNTDNGPVVIEDNVMVKPFSYFEGPVFVGRDTRIIEHSSIKDKSSIACGCKIGGEVEASVIEPHSNKQHHGFLGHSWVGRWINLGAGTTTSDLKNTYGMVSVVYEGQRVSTNMRFLGSIIGDYAKTAINTSLFTGKIIGVCSMVYGMVTTNVPSFSNYARTFGQITEVDPEQVATTQQRMFKRRGITQTDRDAEMIRRVYDLTGFERGIGMGQISF